jgi:hypothetical protein
MTVFDPQPGVKVPHLSIKIESRQLASYLVKNTPSGGAEPGGRFN